MTVSWKKLVQRIDMFMAIVLGSWIGSKKSFNFFRFGRIAFRKVVMDRFFRMSGFGAIPRDLNSDPLLIFAPKALATKILAGYDKYNLSAKI